MHWDFRRTWPADLAKHAPVVRRRGAQLRRELLPLHASVAPAEGEPVIVKHQINAFLDTDLKQVFDADGIKEVTVVGAMSHMCIDAAVRAASDPGYRTTVIQGACAAWDLEFDGQVVPAEQVQVPTCRRLRLPMRR